MTETELQYQRFCFKGEANFEHKESLTHIENKIYNMRNNGLSIDEMAVQLNLKPNTAINHLSHVKAKGW